VPHSYFASGSFNPDELKMLTAVYRDVCHRIEQTGSMELTTQVRETIAMAIFDQAQKGVRNPERLWARAMREVQAFDGVQRTLGRFVKQASTASPSRSRT
jgi:hypothetical protein